MEKFAKDILNTIDNLERALATPANLEDETIKALFGGVELTLKELLATVARFGVEPVGAVGEVFNPDLHQAISMQPSEGFETNQITVVLQKGYLLNGRVIRPAMVWVAAKFATWPLKTRRKKNKKKHDRTLNRRAFPRLKVRLFFMVILNCLENPRYCNRCFIK